jgi:hypothetical protein
MLTYAGVKQVTEVTDTGLWISGGSLPYMDGKPRHDYARGTPYSYDLLQKGNYPMVIMRLDRQRNTLEVVAGSDTFIEQARNYFTITPEQYDKKNESIRADAERGYIFKTS